MPVTQADVTAAWDRYITFSGPGVERQRLATEYGLLACALAAKPPRICEICEVRPAHPGASSGEVCAACYVDMLGDVDTEGDPAAELELAAEISTWQMIVAAEAADDLAANAEAELAAYTAECSCSTCVLCGRDGLPLDDDDTCAACSADALSCDRCGAPIDPDRDGYAVAYGYGAPICMPCHDELLTILSRWDAAVAAHRTECTCDESASSRDIIAASADAEMALRRIAPSMRSPYGVAMGL